MTLAGYAGVIGTLAFVLALVLLVARVARRFLPGQRTSGAPDAFTIVQRIPLGQRQAVAILQRGDTLIGLSVGDGGVRTLFTAPTDVQRSATALEVLPEHDVEADTAAELPPADDADWPALTGTAGVHAFVDAAATLTSERPSTVRALELSGFRKALGAAMRQAAAFSLLLVLGATLAQAQQATAPAPRTAAQPAPARTASPAPAANGTLRTLPPAKPQPGPRDLPVRSDPRAVSPRPASPAPTATKSGGPATIAPLVPAAQARDIAALRNRANGTPPATTEEAERISGRADSMLMKFAPQLDLKLGRTGQGDGLRMSGTVGVVIMMGLLSLLPMLLLMMTGFTRILIVLHFLKQALGTQTTPPGQLVAAMALLLSGFVMAPTLKEVNSTALEPWMDGKIEQVEMMSRASKPFKGFMLRQVRDQDLQTFVDLADAPQPATREDVPLHILMSAFVTSELRTAFQIGFALFLPFIIIDVVVGSVLMSMGMVMLPPALISLPFKLLLFVLVDGWGLVITGLVQSFR